MTIKIKQSPNIDSKQTLFDVSREHIKDVSKGLGFFAGKLTEAAAVHDYDKLTMIDWFFKCLQTEFSDSTWWDNHRKIHRHHLNREDGVPDDVNLVDVIEHVVDCVMAGTARNGEVYDLELPDELLQKAFQNTVELLKNNVELERRTRRNGRFQ